MLEIVELNLLHFWPFKNSRPETYYFDFWFGGKTFPYSLKQVKFSKLFYQFLKFFKKDRCDHKNALFNNFQEHSTTYYKKYKNL